MAFHTHLGEGDYLLLTQPGCESIRIYGQGRKPSAGGTRGHTRESLTIEAPPSVRITVVRQQRPERLAPEPAHHDVLEHDE